MIRCARPGRADALRRFAATELQDHPLARMALAVAGLCMLMTTACTEDALRLPDPSVRYIAFGDSATAGPAGGSYVDFLAERLGEPPAAFANEGRGGETAEEGAERLRSYLHRGLFPNAHTLLYWQGGADLIDFLQENDPLLVFSPDDSDYPFADALDARLDQTQADIGRALAAGREAGLAVFAATYYFFPMGSVNCEPLFLGVLLPAQAEHANEYVLLLNERIRAAAAAQEAILVDVATLDAELRADDANYENCNHLSAAGNDIVAGLWFEAAAANR